jgi:hypothetical protein
VDATAHYRNLAALGREEFLASSATAVLVRYRTGGPDLHEGASTLTLDQDIAETVEHTLPHGKDVGMKDEIDLEVYPLTKKPGASFPDRITIGRTPNNDIVIVDHSVSRFHAYVRQDGKAWVVADAGSKNGSWLASSALEPRKERKLPSRTVLRFGDVDLIFLLAPDLFGALGGA